MSATVRPVRWTARDGEHGTRIGFESKILHSSGFAAGMAGSCRLFALLAAAHGAIGMRADKDRVPKAGRTTCEALC
jgi:hypothetical protein